MPYTKSMPTEHYNLKRYDDGGTIVDTSSVAILPGTRTGERVENFRTKIEKGLDASSNFSTDRYRVESTPYQGYIDFYHPSTPTIVKRQKATWTYPGETFSHLSSVTASMEALVLSKLYDRIRQEKSHLNGLNFVGELRETIHMIRRPAESLVKAAQSLIRLENNKIKKIQSLKPTKKRDAMASLVSGSVLEINFGWRPLFSEIAAAAEALARYYNTPLPRSRVSSTVQSKSVSELFGSKTPVIAQAPGVPVIYLYGIPYQRVMTDASVRYIAFVQSQKSGATSALSRLGDVFGFTAENIIPTLYELTPWSWLADYFSNLGDILSAGTTDTSSVVSIQKLLRLSSTFERRMTPDSGSQNVAAAGYVFSGESQTGGFTTVTRTSFSRQPISSLPLPPLVFTTPSNSPSKLANMISVANQRRTLIRV